VKAFEKANKSKTFTEQTQLELIKKTHYYSIQGSHTVSELKTHFPSIMTHDENI